MSSSKDGVTSPPPRRDPKKDGNKDRSVGDALRAVYQDTVSENVPDEMLDLLNKLG